MAANSNLKITELKSDAKSYQQEIEYLRREAVNSKLEIADLKSVVKTYQQEAVSSKLEITQLKLQNKELKATLDEIQHNWKQINSFVGFSAYATATRIYNDQELVLFDAIHTNYGEAYNPQLSVFQCPVSGYYLFFINVHAQNYDMRPEIYIDGGESFVRTFADNSSDDNSSTMVITYCDALQLVWVRSTGNGARMFGLAENPLSSFSGVLLQQADAGLKF